MSSRISNTTIDSRNAYQQSVWWAQVLGMREDPHDPNEPGHAECMIFSADGRTRLLFIEDGSQTGQESASLRSSTRRSSARVVSAPPRSPIIVDRTGADG